MITEHDVNCIFKWCVNKSLSINRRKDKYTFFLKLISDGFDNDSTPNDVINKVDCLKRVIGLILDGNNHVAAVSNVMKSPMFETLIDFLKVTLEQDMDEDSIDHMNKNITSLTKYSILHPKIKKLQEIADELSAGQFDTYDDAFDIYNKLGLEINKDTKTINDDKLRQSESRIALGNDNWRGIADIAEYKYSSKNKIPSGFDYIDNVMLHGGFERNRLYIFGGATGSGKSTILINMIRNAALYTGYVSELKEKKKIFIYITLENDREESWMRLMCLHFNITMEELKPMLPTNKIEELEIVFKDTLKQYNSDIEMRHFSRSTISSANIGAIIDELVERNGGPDKCIVPAVYMDYLDLISSDLSSTKEERLKLKDISNELKELCGQYRIPVITATQLTREAGRVKSAWDLNVSMVSESKDKADIADFFALIVKNHDAFNNVFFRVGKNRCGETGLPCNFKVDFEHYMFIDCKPAKHPSDNSEKRTDGHDLQFEGGVSTL